MSALALFLGARLVRQMRSERRYDSGLVESFERHKSQNNEPSYARDRLSREQDDWAA